MLFKNMSHVFINKYYFSLSAQNINQFAVKSKFIFLRDYVAKCEFLLICCNIY